MLREWLGERCEGIVALGSRIVATCTVGVDDPLPHVGLTTKGTDFHYDNNDDGNVYSAIVVLGADGNLHLPDVGFKVHVKKGSVVFFPANQLLHKLDIDENAGANAKQFVLTFWTDKRSMDYLQANNHKEDFYGASELDDDEPLKHLMKDCYIVQPGSSD